jgi:hypothetical protein
MSTEVAVLEPRAVTLTAAQIKAQVQLIQQVMKAVMKDGVHYGIIQGTDKPTLYKAGAEVLLATFRIAVDPQIEDLSTEDVVRYRIRCVGTHQTSGTVMGAGIGECSSGEEKYKWRRAVCDEEFDAFPEGRRRTKFARGRNNTIYQNKQVRTEPADEANTVLKMAKKRAEVDFTLTALAASDIFAQDLEDLDPDELAAANAASEDRTREVKQPKSKSAKQAEPAADPSKKLQENQLQFIRKKLGGVTEAQVCARFQVDKIEDIAFSDVNKVIAWVSEQGQSE